jgi:DNA-binding transcriptional LysR family regulator
LRALTDYFCEQAGFTPAIAFEGEEIATLRGLVAAGLGVAIIPAASSPAETTPPQLRISEPVCRRSIGLLWDPARYQPELVQRFRHHIISAFPQTRPTERLRRYSKDVCDCKAADGNQHPEHEAE